MLIKFQPDTVLDFWFPDDGHENSIETHREFWTWRMCGDADNAICERFTELTEAAAMGCLDQWANTARGRLALIIALDQFSRSVWRDTPAAFAQDIKATRIALIGLENGHYQALPNVWEQQFYLIAISHCEGPDHSKRMDRLVGFVNAHVGEAPEHLQSFYRYGIQQNEAVRDIITKYERHPHRNRVLGRISTLNEKEYIALGQFPHQRELPKSSEE
jgi:uncharacterized protein (DUF924 family)